MVLALMRRHICSLLVLVGLLLWISLPARARAQAMGAMPNMPSFGPVATPTGSMFGTGKPAPEADPGIAVTATYVGFIDSAVPRNLFGLRFDSTFNNRQPTRAEYYHPGATGFPFVETRVDYSELTTYAEYSWTPWFSIFMEAPYRWLNPEVNENRSGASDVRYGLKLCTWSSDNVIATILVRLYQPTASPTLGTTHWSVEPGLLMDYQLNGLMHIEGELRYWIPLGGSDYAGNLVRYGLGVSYGRKRWDGGAWFVPVAECIGWTVFSGKTMIASAPDNFVVEDAYGQTIANAYLGLRFGYGTHLEFYAGYGRSFTGDFWQRESYRFEMRFSY